MQKLNTEKHRGLFMQGIKRILRIFFTAIFEAGVIWFFLPVVYGNFLGTGTLFGEFICLAGIFLLWGYKPIANFGGMRKAVIRLVVFFFVAGILWCIYLTGLMFSAVQKTPPRNTPLLLLGARVYDDGKPSQSLRQRIEAAAAYLEENPQAICIATGGKGDDEPFSEALAEKRELVKLGIDESRIYLEDESHSTRENMVNAAKIAAENNLGSDFAVVTQEFHLFRALKLAESAGFKAYAVPARTSPMMLPSYYGRELLSLTKWKLEELFLRGTGQ